MDAQIEIVRGRLVTGRVIHVHPGEEVTFGSGQQNFISVEGEGLSERHGVVRFDVDVLVVSAVSDDAEIRVNGQPARRAVLASGALVEAGGLAFSISRLERAAAFLAAPSAASPTPISAPPALPPPIPAPALAPPPAPPAPVRPSSRPGLAARAFRFSGWSLAAFARSFLLLPLQCRWTYLGILRDRVQLRIGREICAQKGELQKTESLARELHEWEQVSFRMGNLHEEKARARARIREAFDRAMGR
ncbi:MAG: FHA domain-containing protein [Planctomycetota bacterium]